MNCKVLDAGSAQALQNMLDVFLNKSLGIIIITFITQLLVMLIVVSGIRF